MSEQILIFAVTKSKTVDGNKEVEVGQLIPHEEEHNEGLCESYYTIKMSDVPNNAIAIRVERIP
jgi:hypothetical protein